MKADGGCSGPITWDTVGADKLQKKENVLFKNRFKTKTSEH